MTRAVSDGDFTLSEPDLALNRGMIVIRGQICRRSAAATSSAAHILITGYDAAHHGMFQREVAAPQLAGGEASVCRRYAATLAGVRMPNEIEVRAAASGAGGF